MDQLNVAPATKPLADPRDPDRYLRTDALKKDLKGHTIRGGAVTIVAEAIKQLIWIISTAVLARLLSPSDNGLIAMVIVLTGFMELFKDLGLSAAVIQRDKIDQQQASTLFWINVAVGIVLALLTAALAPAVAWFYEEPRLVNITFVLAGGFVLSGLMIQHRSLLRRQMRLTVLAVIDVGSTLFETAVGIWAAMNGFGYWSLVITLLAGAPLEVAAMWIICRWRPNRPARAAGIRSMLAFGGNLMGYRTVNYLLRNVDNVLIGRVYGPQPLGLYAKAYNLLLLPINRVNGPISVAAIPALSRLVDQPGRYREAFSNIASKVCLLTMPLVAFMLGTADWLVLVVLGPQWVEAGRIFAWLGISGLIEPITYAAIWLFLTQGRARQQFHWGLISSALMVAAIVAGLPWGPVGVAAAYGMVSLCIRLPLLFWYVGREGPVRTRDLYGVLMPFAGAVIVSLLGILAFRQWSGVSNPLVGLLACAAITGAGSLLTLAIIPSGRPAIRDLKSIAITLLRPRAAV
jgi:PST family polysaccharide transporter